MEIVSIQMIEEAKEALKGVAVYTPVVPAAYLGEKCFLKLDNLQEVGSFKIRGSYNKMRLLSEEDAKKGVIACSAGNHAQGVALSAKKLGIHAKICVPEKAPKTKVEATKAHGAEVVLVPGVFDDAAAEAARLVEENGCASIHCFEDPEVIAGQGTVGLEILEQVPDVEQILVAIGGGGLISGIAIAVKSKRPQCKIIGVQPEVLAAMHTSRCAGKLTTIDDAETISDGTHVRTPGKLTFELCQEFVDEIVTVTEAEIRAAMVTLLRRSKTLAEGAGALSVAAVMAGKVDAGLKTVCLVSGGNVDLDKVVDIINAEE